LLTPSATECEPKSLGPIWMTWVGGSLMASPATLAWRGQNNDKAIKPANAAARIKILVAMMECLRAAQRVVDRVLTP
jgi:hypothetical protein